MNEEEIDRAVIAQTDNDAARREDICDGLLAKQRAGESRESLASVKERLMRQGKLNG